MLTILFGSTSWGATYFVSTSGNNSSNGSQSAPWQTIQHALDNIVSGDTVIINAGIYQENVTSRTNGTSNNRINIKANANVILRGRIYLRHSYITVEGFEITNSGERQAILADRNANHIEILNNDIHDIGSGARFIELPRSEGIPTAPMRWIIRGNRLYGQDSATIYILLGGVGHTIENNEIGPGVISEDAFRPFGDNHVIRNNYIHDIQSGGGHTDLMQIFSSNNWRVFNLLFEKNYIRGWDGQAWMFSVTPNSQRITIRNNIFENVRSAGQSYCPLTKVYNNTFINSGFGNCRVIMMRGASGRGIANNSEVMNNIFYHTGCDENNGWYSVDSVVSGFVGDYNLIFPNKNGFTENHGINGLNPRFINAEGSDFHLSSNSPAIDAGTMQSGFNDDYDGNVRPSGAEWDIGAFESEYKGTANLIPIFLLLF